MLPIFTFGLRNENPFQAFAAVDEILRQVSRSPLLSSGLSNQANVAQTPRFEMEETSDGYDVNLEMPGVNKDDIDVRLHGTTLTVEGRLTRGGQERRYECSFDLPPHVSGEKIEATYRDGVLRVTLPKLDSAKTRIIKVSDSDNGFINKLLGASFKKETEVTASQAESRPAASTPIAVAN